MNFGSKSRNKELNAQNFTNQDGLLGVSLEVSKESLDNHAGWMKSRNVDEITSKT